MCLALAVGGLEDPDPGHRCWSFACFGSTCGASQDVFTNGRRATPGGTRCVPAPPTLAATCNPASRPGIASVTETRDRDLLRRRPLSLIPRIMARSFHPK